MGFVRYCNDMVEKRENLSTPAKLAVVIVNFNGKTDTIGCIPSVLASSMHPSDIIVVDNGSIEREDIDIQREFPSITVIRSEENLGWSGGNNLGAFRALENGADWLFLLNNDTVLLPGWWESIQEVIKTDEWDLFGPVINEFHQPLTVQTEGVAFNPRGKNVFFDRISVPLVEPWGNDAKVKITPCDIVNGCAVLFRSDLFRKLNGIDDRFFLICEESDFCLRAKTLQARIGVMNRSLVLHKHSVSFAKAGKPVQRYYSIRNLGLLLSKHQFGGERKNRFSSWFAYVRWVHHMHAYDTEQGNTLGARAISDGFADFLLGRFGRRETPRRGFVASACSVFFRFTTFLSRLR